MTYKSFLDIVYPDDREYADAYWQAARCGEPYGVAIATAYTDTVTERLKIFLQEHGFDIVAAKGLGYERIPQGAATQDILHKLGVAAYANSNKADALVMSCGALKTLDLIVPLEASIGAPVVSSTPHGLWHCARMLGPKARIQGFGMVMAA